LPLSRVCPRLGRALQDRPHCRGRCHYANRARVDQQHSARKPRYPEVGSLSLPRQGLNITRVWSFEEVQETMPECSAARSGFELSPVQKAIMNIQSHLVRIIGATILTWTLALPLRAYAIDFYEIEVYQTETTPQGHLQLELHSNTVSTATGEEAKAALNPYQIHETLEATYGLRPWLEVGQYFATAKLNNGQYEYAGSRTKMHFGVPQTEGWPVRFGGNIELDYMRFESEENPMTLELRPIAETSYGRLNTSYRAGSHPRSNTTATWERCERYRVCNASSISSCQPQISMSSTISSSTWASALA